MTVDASSLGVALSIDPPASAHVSADPVALLVSASTPVQVTAAILIVASIATWTIGLLKLGQLARLTHAQRAFEHRCASCRTIDALIDAAATDAAVPGASIVTALAAARARGAVSNERVFADVDRALVDVRQSIGAWQSTVGTIAAVAPFIGLFGTVYGIMDAFVRIGAAQSASIAVVAPAIGEALVTTAIGLATAIPAVLFFNAIDRRAGALIEIVEGGARVSAATFVSAPPGPHAAAKFDASVPDGARRATA